jgi:hypothetical protein
LPYKNRSCKPAKPDAPGGHVVGLKMQCACLALSDAAWACGSHQGRRLPAEIVSVMREHSRAARVARRDWKAAAERQRNAGFGMVMLTLTHGPRVRHGRRGVRTDPEGSGRAPSRERKGAVKGQPTASRLVEIRWMAGAELRQPGPGEFPVHLLTSSGCFFRLVAVIP